MIGIPPRRLPKNYSEHHLLAWIAPRRIVAAAISALFAIRLESIGYPQSAQMVPLSFMVIIGTVLLLFAIDAKDRIHPFTPDVILLPETGWKIISLTVNREPADSAIFNTITS